MSTNFSASEISIFIVLSEFNLPIIKNLQQGAQAAFSHHGGINSNLKVFRVPGAFEIPGTIQQILKVDSPDAIVALGAVIRGETPHFDYVSGESIRGISEISRNSSIPIINGILTTDNTKQAEERSQLGGSNKGWDAMEAALKTINVYKEIFSAAKC